jgi:hypothetical protein
MSVGGRTFRGRTHLDTAVALGSCAERAGIHLSLFQTRRAVGAGVPVR